MSDDVAVEQNAPVLNPNQSGNNTYTSIDLNYSIKNKCDLKSNTKSHLFKLDHKSIIQRDLFHIQQSMVMKHHVALVELVGFLGTSLVLPTK